MRDFLRLCILGIALALAYFWAMHHLPWIGLMLIYILLFLFYLATYVQTLEQINEREEGDGIPTNPTELYQHFAGILRFVTDGKERMVF